MRKKKDIFSKDAEKKVLYQILGIILIITGSVIIFPFMLKLLEVIIGIACIAIGIHFVFKYPKKLSYWFR